MPGELILISGFEPFAKASRNPSAAVVEALHASGVGEIVSKVLPVEYQAAADQLNDLLIRIKPTAWIGFGLNQRATAITLERVAVNLDDASIADNSGDLRQGVPIDSHAPASYPSTLPLQAIHSALSAHGIPTVFSDTAGRYVCNHLFYCAAHTVDRLKLGIPCGFIHVPWPVDWNDFPSPGHAVTLQQLIKAAELIVTVTRSHGANLLGSCSTNGAGCKSPFIGMPEGLSFSAQKT